MLAIFHSIQHVRRIYIYVLTHETDLREGSANLLSLADIPSSSSLESQVPILDRWFDWTNFAEPHGHRTYVHLSYEGSAVTTWLSASRTPYMSNLGRANVSLTSPSSTQFLSTPTVMCCLHSVLHCPTTPSPNILVFLPPPSHPSPSLFEAVRESPGLDADGAAIGSEIRTGQTKPESEMKSTFAYRHPSQEAGRESQLRDLHLHLRSAGSGWTGKL